MKPFYALNFGIINPFRDTYNSYFERKFKFDQIEILNSDILSDSLIEIFKIHDLKFHSCVLWKWDLSFYHEIHTDGNYFKGPKRACGINWNFSLDTSVKFYSMKNGNPVSETTNAENFSTIWRYDNEPIEIAEWRGGGPVLFDPQIPHRIHKDSDTNIRKSLVLRFSGNFYDLYFKLKKYII